MKTEVLRVNPTDPEPDIIARAAEVLKRGGLAAFPTETVYGLGACAYNAEAVGRIFAAKGRPANNPLIVHLAKAPTSGERPNEFWPNAASKLAARFWPGPLTLVLPKPPDLPGIVTAGGRTWAIRVPDHAVSHAIVSAAGPLAAPSANISSGVSPTTAQHVLSSLDGKIDLVLDGGPCPRGVESTVLDLTSSPPRVLRPGPIGPSELRAVIGEVIAPDVRLTDKKEALPSPGTSIRHYAPRATLECYANEAEARERVDELCRREKRVRWLSRSDELSPRPQWMTQVQGMPLDAAAYAAILYDTLHRADRDGVDYIIVSLPPDEEEWLAVRDRLRRAATVWRG